MSVSPLASDAALAVPALMAAVVVTTLYVLGPPVNRRVVLALTPWMVVGGAVHALYTADAYPASFSLRPFFGPVSVYFTTVVAVGLTWATMTSVARLVGSDGGDAQYLTAAGVGAALSVLAIVLARADDTEAAVPVFAGLVVAAALATVVYLVVTVLHTPTLVRTGLLGLVVVFAHTLDAVIATVGVATLGTGAGDGRSAWLLAHVPSLPVPAAVEAALALVGVRVVLVAVAVVVVATAVDRPILRDHARTGHVALGAVAAVGLGPGVHRFLSLVV